MSSFTDVLSIKTCVPMFTSLYSSHASSSAVLTLRKTLFFVCSWVVYIEVVHSFVTLYVKVGLLIINYAATVKLVTISRPAIAMLIALSSALFC